MASYAAACREATILFPVIPLLIITSTPFGAATLIGADCGIINTEDALRSD